MDKSDEPPERSRAARRASKTRERLLDAALAIINTHGFEGCSIEEITELADVGKGTFYRHFNDKASVLKDLLETAVGDLLTRLQDRRNSAHSLDTAVAAVMESHTEGFQSRPDLFLLFLQAQNMTASRPAAAQDLNPFFNAFFGEIEKTLSPFIPAETNEVSRHRLFCATSAAIPGFVMSALSNRKSAQEVTGQLEAVTQAFLAGIPRLLR